MIKVSSPLLNFGCGSLRWSWSRELQRQQEFALKLERRAAATAGIWDEAGASAATTTGIFRWNWSRERQRPQRFALKLKQMATAATEIWDEAGARAAATAGTWAEASLSSSGWIGLVWGAGFSDERVLLWREWLALRELRLFRSGSWKETSRNDGKLPFPLKNEPIYTIAPLLRTRHVNFVDHGLALFAWHELPSFRLPYY